MNDEALIEEQMIELCGSSDINELLHHAQDLHESNELNKDSLRKAVDLMIAYGNLINQLEFYAKRNEALTLEQFQELRYFFTAHIMDDESCCECNEEEE
jgi:hypothetical protein